jgi:tetraacyldisaccharide 4'-kinase
MTRPGFWFTPPEAPDPRARLLAPLGWLQARMTARRIARGRGWRAPVPVICVGSLDAGNVGVMPAVQALALHLQSRGRSPAILSRATDAAAPLIVDERRHTAADVGDAPLLSAVFATTWIAPDLASGARAITGASAPTADCILLDGGFQDPSLIKDLSVIAVDAVRGFGNGRCIPAGPLREPVTQGLSRADLLLSVGPPAAQTAFRRAWPDIVDAPTIRGRMEPLQTGMDWRDARILAFVGLDDPDGFFAILKGLGANLIRTETLGDRRPMTTTLMTRLKREAQLRGAQLVTTERQAVRLPASFRREVLTLPIRLQIQDHAPLDSALKRRGL